MDAHAEIATTAYHLAKELMRDVPVPEAVMNKRWFEKIRNGDEKIIMEMECSPRLAYVSLLSLMLITTATVDAEQQQQASKGHDANEMWCWPPAKKEMLLL